jgi:diguanylate cyclase (GGDEF)-like protein
MDPFTAGISLILVQFCVALVMAGVFLATPTEKSTRYWALSGLLIALGVVVAVLNNRQPRPAFALNGTGLIIAGLICQWHGIQIFYRRMPSYWGWGIGVAFYATYTVCFIVGTSFQFRSAVLSTTLLILLGLSFHAVWSGQNGLPRTFVRSLVLGAIALLITGNLLRLGLYVMQMLDLLPLTRSTFDVVVSFLIPLVGTVLFSTGLMLLYFERTVEENRHLATHDELSKLLNRRAIVALGERELQLSQRLHRELTIAFIDIDLFKNFNDTFGHDAGDTVIVDVARIFGLACRNIDVVGRYGGEEFLIILPGASRADAAIIGDRLVKAIRDYRFRGMHPVTVSIGLATLPKDDATCTWDGLMLRADAALYEAKGLGRDRFCA